MLPLVACIEGFFSYLKDSSTQSVWMFQLACNIRNPNEGEQKQYLFHS